MIDPNATKATKRADPYEAAPTTLPTLQSAPLSAANRIGGMLASPVRTFRTLADTDGGNLLEGLALYAVVAVALIARVIVRHAWLWSMSSDLALRRVGGAWWSEVRADLGTLLGTVVVVALLARRRVSTSRAILTGSAAVALLVPLATYKALSASIATGLGLGGWWWPHLAVDSPAVVVGTQPSVARFVAKCVITYGPLLAILVGWLATRARPLSPPRAFIARAGLSVAVVVIGVLLPIATARDVWRTKEQLRPLLPGDALPSMTLRRLDAPGRYDLGALRGHVAIVDFWASWCPPCRRAMPELSTIADEFAAQGVIVLGVNREPRDLPAARKAAAELKPRFPLVVDDAGLGERAGLTSLPSSFVLDRDGVIRALHLGYVAPDIVRGEVRALVQGEQLHAPDEETR